MMVYKVILLQLCSYFLSDFILETDKMSHRKFAGEILWTHITHSLLVGFCSYFCSMDLAFWRVSIFMVMSHFIFDLFRLVFFPQGNTAKTILVEVSFKIGVIVFFSILYTNTFHPVLLLDLNIKTIAIILGLLVCTKPANVIIKHLFEAFSIEVPSDDGKDNDDKSLPNAGKLIGITERLLTFVLVILGEYEAVGLIIAAKSILRVNSTKKSEYVLVGTLLSFGIAIFLGIAIGSLSV